MINLKIHWKCILDEPWIYPDCTPDYSATRYTKYSSMHANDDIILCFINFQDREGATVHTMGTISGNECIKIVLNV